MRGEEPFRNPYRLPGSESPPCARGRVGFRPNPSSGSGITPACAGKSALLSCPDLSRVESPPRARGRGYQTSARTPPYAESPPRARGRAGTGFRPLASFGITPACAGKSLTPRFDMGILEESPPRARGRVIQVMAPASTSGITPACAGKRMTEFYTYNPCGNHPRVRGEEDSVVGRGVAHGESPPRARGRVLPSARFVAVWGITPACAGKSKEQERVERAIEESPPRARGRAGRSHGTARGSGNHPRVRGEEPAEVFIFELGDGITPACAGKSCTRVRMPVSSAESPPRARGRAAHEGACRGGVGITPACAGKSGRRTTDRTCDLESPPRARGRAIRDGADITQVGITPACAGKSNGLVRHCWRDWNHPRVRGEESAASGTVSTSRESPPRARGRDHSLAAAILASGITPACAGKRVMKMRP